MAQVREFTAEEVEYAKNMLIKLDPCDAWLENDIRIADRWPASIQARVLERLTQEDMTMAQRISRIRDEITD